METWKDVKGYEGYYQVSDLGNIKSLKTDKVLKPFRVVGSIATYYRLVVDLYKEGKRKHFKVHRLVAMHFIPNVKGCGKVDHIDGNTSNNCVTNVRWVSDSENSLNSKLCKRNKTGVKGVRLALGRQTSPWVAEWRENNKTKMKRFASKEDAVRHRRAMVELHYSKEHYVEDRLTAV